MFIKPKWKSKQKESHNNILLVYVNDNSNLVVFQKSKNKLTRTAQMQDVKGIILSTEISWERYKLDRTFLIPGLTAINERITINFIDVIKACEQKKGSKKDVTFRDFLIEILQACGYKTYIPTVVVVPPPVK